MKGDRRAPLRLIVTDTSPLITLALAEELDLLLRPEISVSVPDAVYVEATRLRSASGATVIVDWLNANRTRAQIAPTEIGVDQLRRLAEGRSIRGLGEAAAIEVLDRFVDEFPQAEAMLLFEDSDVTRRRGILDARVTLVSTGDFLRELEYARLIQSSDRILDKAAAEGRNVERQRSSSAQPEPIEVFRRHLSDKGTGRNS